MGSITGDVLREAGNAAGTVVRETGNAAGTVAGEAGKAAGTVAGEAGKAAGTVVGEAGKAAGTVAGEAGKAAGTVAGEAGKAAGTVERETRKRAGEIERETKKGLGDAAREGQKGLGNVDTTLRKAHGDVERTVRQFGGDVGRELKATQHEVGDAATAVYRYAVREAESSIDSVREADKRFREGKVIDALWGLAADPARGTSDNAAKLAQENQIVGTIMQSAASFYGGPAGAAAYAAWLAYYQTGGDLNAALRVGLKVAVQSYGTAYFNGLTPVPGANATAAATFQHAAVAGAINGLAVAADGGSVADMQKAMLATAGSVLVQDGYRTLAATPGVAKFAQTARQVYCVKSLVERANDKSCPSVNDYLKDAKGRYAMLDKSGLVKYVDLKKEIPGAEWAFLSREQAMKKAADAAGVTFNMDKVPAIPPEVQKTMAEMKKVKKNIVPLFDDRWAISYQPAKDAVDMSKAAAVELRSVKAAVAPAVLLTYTGVSSRVAGAAADAKKAADAALPKQPQEIVSCVNKAGTTQRVWIAKGQPGDDLRCVVGRQVNAKVGAVGYAKVDRTACQPMMLTEAKKLIAAGYTCSGR